MTRKRDDDLRDTLPPERDGQEQTTNAPDPAEGERLEPNPPRTTTGPVTAPKFGSAGSGGAELEPGPKRHRDS